MNLLKPLLVAAAALAASQAHAVSTFTYTYTAVPVGSYTAPSFTDGTMASVQTTSKSWAYLQPQGTTGAYLVVSGSSGSSGSATIDTHDLTSYSFVWGSPDTFNDVTVYDTDGTTAQYSGSNLASQFGLKANGNNAETGLFTITATQGSIDHVVLQSSGVAFEIAAPVPEPETYALMLGGLGALAFVSRRRRA